MKRFASIFAVVFLFTSALQARDLFRVLPGTAGRVHTEAVETQSVRVQVDKDALAEGDVTVYLGGKSYRATHGVVEWTNHEVVTSENVRDYTAQFTLEDSRNPSVLVVWRGVAAGMLVTPDNISYELDPDPSGEASLLTRVDWSKFHCEVAELQGNGAKIAALAADIISRRRAVAPGVNHVINLAEFYTPLAMAGIGGQAKMEALIQAAVAMLNTSAHQSGATNVTFRLVYTGLIQFNEADPKLTGYGDVLSWISTSLDAAAIRNQVRAHLVGLWIEGAGGVAWAPRSNREFRPDSGFHVIGWGIGLAIAGGEHEMAHNLGPQHDVLAVSAASVDDFPFARAKCSPALITAMGSTKCLVQGMTANWIPYFSNNNPSLTYNGQMMGSDMENNVRMMEIGASLVEGYYPQVSKSNP